MKAKKQTAAEFLAELERDPNFRAQRREREESFRRREEELAQAEAPLVQALAEAGVDVKSVWDLVNSDIRHYPSAIPVLLDHLQRPYPDALRDGIARALAVPETRSDWEMLTKLYRDENGKRTKDGLAVAIAAAATEDVIADVISLARDSKHGTSRLLLLRALERSQDPRSRQALSDLGTDPELQKEIQITFQRIKRQRY